MPDAARAPLRLLVVMPSWVGDVVMATPTIRRVRERFRGSFIGGLVRPGMDQLLAGTTFFDELHVERASGVMGPKFVAAKVRPRRYDTALLLTNSFSTALVVRLAGIPRRIGYDRDARGLLLTDRLEAPRRDQGGFAPVPAVNYYMNLANRYLLATPTGAAPAVPDMELATTPKEERAADELLARAGVPATAPTAILNPGGNNPAKRWPPDRFAALADHLALRHNLTILINGSPAESDLVAAIAAACRTAKPIQLPGLGITLGTLKALTRRSRLMVTTTPAPATSRPRSACPLCPSSAPPTPAGPSSPPARAKPS